MHLLGQSGKLEKHDRSLCGICGLFVDCSWIVVELIYSLELVSSFEQDMVVSRGYYQTHVIGKVGVLGALGAIVFGTGSGTDIFFGKL